MSFSGGGGAGGAITAHVHSNAAGEGGNLEISDSGTLVKIDNSVYTLGALL